MILIIAQNTFKEAIRQRLILFASLIALGLIIASKYLLRLDLGHDQLRFVFDFSSGALNFFGIIIAIVSTCSLLSAEIENKTVITLLSKSVNTIDFILGKFVGIAVVLGVFCISIFLSASLMLWLTSLSLMNAGIEDVSVNYIGFIIYCFLQWLKLCMCVSITLVICGLSKSFLFAVSCSFMCVLICIMGETLVALGGKENAVSIIVGYILPDFQLMDIADDVIGKSLNFLKCLWLSVYALVYIVVCTLLSAWAFSKRDF